MSIEEAEVFQKLFEKMILELDDELTICDKATLDNAIDILKKYLREE